MVTKLCKNCKAEYSSSLNRCPSCGSNDFTHLFKGSVETAKDGSGERTSNS